MPWINHDDNSCHRRAIKEGLAIHFIPVMCHSFSTSFFHLLRDFNARVSKQRCVSLSSKMKRCWILMLLTRAWQLQDNLCGKEDKKLFCERGSVRQSSFFEDTSLPQFREKMRIITPMLSGTCCLSSFIDDFISLQSNSLVIQFAITPNYSPQGTRERYPQLR